MSPDPPVLPIVVIGAGPAGLTAAYELVQRGERPVVLEADDIVGGISRTVERNGWRFDIGGHRFFTKVPDVELFWDEILPPEDFPVRPRLSRIHYRGRFFDYPLKAGNALWNLGLVEAFLCVLSYFWARIRPPRDRSTFEGWTASRFGWRLYRIFFKTYTEKVWGVPADRIQADWAAQRIKNLSLFRAVFDALWPGKGPAVTSLIDEFRYPRLGPGMMWERCAEVVVAAGADLRLGTTVMEIHHASGRATAVVAEDRSTGARTEIACRGVISSMPLGSLVTGMQPVPPEPVTDAAEGLRYRDFLTVALVVPEEDAFPDNWIYVHSPEVRLGRVQNFGAWSPDMVRPGLTCLGLEYFVFEGDDLWQMADDELVALGTRELAAIGLIDAGRVQEGYVVRMPLAYPTYDESYRGNVEAIRAWLEAHAGNVVPVGRNGMHRYNNQDHSMYTAMLAVDNLVDGAEHDIWAVNVDDEYHEEAGGDHADVRGTGRSAPILPTASPP